MINKFPKVSYIEGQQLLRDAYDQAFGVFNHTEQRYNERSRSDPNQKRPLSSVAHHYAEDIVGTTSFSNLVAIFGQLKIYERFGVTLPAFLAMPREYTQVIIDQAKRYMSQMEEAQAAAARAVEEERKRLAQQTS